MTHPNRYKKSGFSLVELLAVVAIIAFLLAIGAPSMRSVIQSADLTATGDSVHGILHTARQAARARNVPVEIRFYREDRSSYVQSLEAFVQRDDGSFERIGDQQFDEENGIITSKPDMTTLLTGDLYEDPQVNRVGPKTYQVFRFRPDGSTELEETQKWFLSLLYDKDSVENYYTIQINPFSGNLKIYRP